MISILFVTDNPSRQADWKNSSTSFPGYIDFASCAEEAIELLKHIPPDILVFDATGERNNINSLQLLCKREDHPPLIVITGVLSQDNEISLSQINGVIDILPGSLQNEKILTKLRNLHTLIAHHDRISKKRSTSDQIIIRRQKMELVGHITASVFHDINNMLAIIGGYSQLIRFSPQDMSSSLEQINISCKFASEFMHNTLQFATGNPIEKSDIILGDMVDQGVKFLRHCISKRIELRWTKPNESLLIMGNEAHLLQLLMNICFLISQEIIKEGLLEISVGKNNFSRDQCLKSGKSIPRGNYARLSITDPNATKSRKCHSLFHSLSLHSDAVSNNGSILTLVGCHRIIQENNSIVNVVSFPEKGISIELYFSLDSRLQEVDFS